MSNQDIMQKLRKHGYDAGRKCAEGIIVNFGFSLPDIIRADRHSTLSKLDAYCEGIVSGTRDAVACDSNGDDIGVICIDCATCAETDCAARKEPKSEENLNDVFAPLPAPFFVSKDFDGLSDDL